MLVYMVVPFIRMNCFSSLHRLIIIASCLGLTLPTLVLHAKAQASSGTSISLQSKQIENTAGSPHRNTKNSPAKTPPFQLTNKANRFIQRVTGITFLSEIISNSVAGYVLKKKLGGKVTAHLKTWSLTDLLAGKIESIKISLRGCNIKGAPLGTIAIHSENPIWYNYRKHSNERRDFKVPVMMNIDMLLDQATAASALQTNKVASSLGALKLDLPGLGAQQLAVLNPQVAITDGLITINALLLTAGAQEETGVPIMISGNPKLEGDSRIVLENIAVSSPEIVEPQKFAQFIEELLNPIVNFSRFDRPTMAFRLNSLIVKDGAVKGTGHLLLAPHPAQPGPVLSSKVSKSTN